VEYRIVFYETENGEKPLVEFLESLRGRNDPLHKLVVAGLRKLKNRDNHGPPLTASLEGSSLMELRVGRTDIARVFFFFRPNREIVCTNGYIKKSQKLDPKEVARAERYRADWEQRHP
jgi:phage-related protein